MFSDPKKCFLDIGAFFFPRAIFFFLGTRFFPCWKKKKSSCKKKNPGKEKNVLSLYQENIFLASEITVIVENIFHTCLRLCYHDDEIVPCASVCSTVGQPDVSTQSLTPRGTIVGNGSFYVRQLDSPANKTKI